MLIKAKATAKVFRLKRTHTHRERERGHFPALPATAIELAAGECFRIDLRISPTAECNGREEEPCAGVIAD
jgi:hypothetical protein